ncbi:unnamed protein product [Cylindrotheca closterium]|uniref:Orotidine 5'-phosphate decarboxylase n=1 Tax=Cylindrotheca closterium TaxID=2856 RepID=A0AAD2CM98_9STRA|nr:unnamed protein product [Cylindrotheca closterium]
MTSFFAKLEARVNDVDSLLCVGLDPHSKDIGSDDVKTPEDKCAAAFTFCKTIIDATLPYAACYKPNAAFFEALGSQGETTLERVLKEIPSNVPILLDVKRGDIGSTATAYAEACYEHLKADAVTLSPLMGWDSVAPFVTESYAHKGAFLLCKTSNPGSNDILALNLANGEKLYERIAKLAHDWSTSSGASLGLVVGATDSVALANARKAAGEKAWILAPGVGAQGGDLEAALRAGMNSNGTAMLIPVSRGISRAEDRAAAAKELMVKINETRKKLKSEEGSSSGDAIQPYQKEFLEFSLSQGVLKFGSFVLKSGRTSPYFFNAGLFASGAALDKLGRSYASAIMAAPQLVDGKGGVAFDVLFGPAYKGISLGAVTAAALYRDYGIDVGYAYNRKEAKDHGEGGQLVGAGMTGKRVLVIDDVITAGTAIRESHEMLTTIGAKMVGVVIALDRAEKRSLEDPVSAVQAVERDLSVSVTSIVNLQQLQLFLEKSPDYGNDVLATVKEYRSKFGV